MEIPVTQKLKAIIHWSQNLNVLVSDLNLLFKPLHVSISFDEDYVLTYEPHFNIHPFICEYTSIIQGNISFMHGSMNLTFHAPHYPS